MLNLTYIFLRSLGNCWALTLLLLVLYLDRWNEWKRDRLKALDLMVGSTSRLIDERWIDKQKNRLMIDRWTKDTRTEIIWSVNWWTVTEDQMNGLEFWQSKGDWRTIDRLTDELEDEGVTNQFSYALHNRLCGLIDSMAAVLKKTHAISLLEIQNSGIVSLI
jgi:hypothetical protein